MVRGKYWPKKKLLCHSCGVSQCWETRIGQEMYKLTLFDLLINMAVLVLVEFPRRYGQLCHHITLEVNALHDSVMFLFVFFHFRMLVDNVSNKLVQSFGRQEFVVPSNVLGLVYGQTVVWMGALFCPLLPLINVAKFIILFYIKKVTHLVLTSVTNMAEIVFFFPLLDFNSTYI